MHKHLLTATMVLTCFLFGAGSMYLIDSTWVYDKVDRGKEKVASKATQYSQALDVSQNMVSNCYDAFYTIAECSRAGGCDFKSTADSLTELNIERKVLRLELDLLLSELGSPGLKEGEAL